MAREARNTATDVVPICGQLDRATSPKVQKHHHGQLQLGGHELNQGRGRCEQGGQRDARQNDGFGESFLSRAKSRMTAVAPMAPANAKAVVETTPAPNATMESAAPKAAPWLIPSVEGDPSGFFQQGLNTQAGKRQAHPQTNAAATLGRRMLSTTTRDGPSASPARAEKISPIGIW